MYGKLRIQLVKCSDQFNIIGRKLGENGHMEAQRVIDDVVNIRNIDEFCAAHYFARHTDVLIKALTFCTYDYPDAFVDAVITGATGYACGYYSTISAPERASAWMERMQNVVIRNKLDVYNSPAEVEEAYSTMRKNFGWMFDNAPADVRERIEKAVTIQDAAVVFFDLCRDYALNDFGTISTKYYDFLAIAHNGVAWGIAENGGKWNWMPLARKLQGMPKQKLSDYFQNSADTDDTAAKQLHFVRTQISLNNFKVAAACAIAWRDELKTLLPYVSQNTAAWINEACK